MDNTKPSLAALMRAEARELRARGELMYRDIVRMNPAAIAANLAAGRSALYGLPVASIMAGASELFNLAADLEQVAAKLDDLG